MSAPTTRSPRIEAMMDAIVSREERDDDYWEDLSVLGKEVASSRAIRDFVVARCARGLDGASAPAIVRLFDVLRQLEAPVAHLAATFARHANEPVRLAVIVALEGNHSADAIAALVSLCSDASVAVRIAAVRALVRGLGVPSEHDFVDTFVVRDALARCLDDEPLVHEEAVIGLALRKDPRACEPLAAMLAECLTGQRIDAAYWLASPDLRAILQRHKDEGTTAYGEWTLDDAIAACTVDHA
jgi:hypothetical protein